MWFSCFMHCSFGSPLLQRIQHWAKLGEGHGSRPTNSVWRWKSWRIKTCLGVRILIRKWRQKVTTRPWFCNGLMRRWWYNLWQNRMFMVTSGPLMTCSFAYGLQIRFLECACWPRNSSMNPTKATKWQLAMSSWPLISNSSFNPGEDWKGGSWWKTVFCKFLDTAHEWWEIKCQASSSTPTHNFNQNATERLYFGFRSSASRSGVAHGPPHAFIKHHEPRKRPATPTKKSCATHM